MAKRKGTKKTLEEVLVLVDEQPYQVPENWVWITLEYVAQIIMGQSPVGDATTDDNSYTPLIGGAADMGVLYPAATRYTKVPTKVSTAQDIIICIRATLGRPIFSDGEYCLGRGVAAVRPHLGTKAFFRYFFLNFEQYLYDCATGTTFAQVSSQTLQKMPFPLPPLAEQQRIAEQIEHLFSKLDEAKEKAQAVVDGFETRKATILHKAFTGELTAQWRRIHSIPLQSWKHHKFSEICTVVRGGSPRPAGDPKYYDGTIPFMKVADITNNNSPFVSSTQYTIKEAGLKKTRLIAPNTLLLTNSGATLGVPAICTFETTFNDGIAAFLNLDTEHLLFYYYFWTSKTSELRGINKGAAQPNLNTDIIGSIEIDIPSGAEQDEIVRLLEDILTKEQQAKEATEVVIDQINTMKKSILIRAFRGELGTNDPAEQSAVELLKEIL